jgi:hypothetical protein
MKKGKRFSEPNKWQNGVERCALCQEEKSLQQSHLLPRASFKIIRNYSNPERQQLILVREGIAIQSSRQFTCQLLCRECENLLNVKGEHIVMNECFRDDGSFPLRSLLENEVPAISAQHSQWFSGTHLKNINVNAYRYFAASVFWRGSVGRWGQRKPLGCEHSLGPKYEEAFRHYLLGEIPTPKQALLLVFVFTDIDENVLTFWPPQPSNEGGYYVHHFAIPGIEFRMFLGGCIDPRIQQFFDCLNTNTVFVLTQFRVQPRFEHLVDSVQRAKLKGKIVYKQA